MTPRQQWSLNLSMDAMLASRCPCTLDDYIVRLAKMARHPMPRRDFTQQRGLEAASLLRVGAASVEGAAGRRVHRTRYVAGKRALRPLELGVWSRPRREQRFGMAMQGTGAECRCLGTLAVV